MLIYYIIYYIIYNITYNVVGIPGAYLGLSQRSMMLYFYGNS